VPLLQYAIIGTNKNPNIRRKSHEHFVLDGANKPNRPTAGHEHLLEHIANLNTVGYKPLRPSFAECLYTHQHHNRDIWQTGHGQRLFKTDFMFDQGGLTFTDMPLDFAMVSEAFFMVESSTAVDDGLGEGTYFPRFLTRDGRFGITNVGDEWEWQLVNGFGEFVLDHDGNRITIPFVVNDAGETTTEIDYGALYDTIGAFTVPNNWGLDQAENNRFVVTGRSGEPVSERRFLEGAGLDYRHSEYFMPQAVELSAVDIAGEMVRVIETQRSYQLNARIIQTSDELMRIVNNLM